MMWKGLHVCLLIAVDDPLDNVPPHPLPELLLGWCTKLITLGWAAHRRSMEDTTLSPQIPLPCSYPAELFAVVTCWPAHCSPKHLLISAKLRIEYTSSSANKSETQNHELDLNTFLFYVSVLFFYFSLHFTLSFRFVCYSFCLSSVCLSVQSSIPSFPLFPSFHLFPSFLWFLYFLSSLCFFPFFHVLLSFLLSFFYFLHSFFPSIRFLHSFVGFF